MFLFLYLYSKNKMNLKSWACIMYSVYCIIMMDGFWWHGHFDGVNFLISYTEFSLVKLTKKYKNDSLIV